MRDHTKHSLRVGLLTLMALAVLAVAVLTIGSRQQFFRRHIRYVTDFSDVTGLQIGAPVTLNGVTVGFVEAIELPEDPQQERISVRFSLDDRYTERIRLDSEVSIRTIGLLGDKYLAIRGGSSTIEKVPEGGSVRGVDPAEVSRLVASGEGLMENLLAISASLKVILRRVERGQGLLGELTTPTESGEKLSTTIQATFDELQSILQSIESGQGLLGRLISDRELGRQLPDDVTGAARSLRSITNTIEDDLTRDDNAYSALFNDPEGARLMRETLVAVNNASEALAAVAEELATGRGTLPRLMADEEYANEFLDDLHKLIEHLRSIGGKMDSGEGAAGAFVNDPQLYQDLENVVRGVNNSKVVSWFIRNRRAKGEKISRRESQEEAGQH
jgi:phospholipid/cholesterol/gamma-HCH transport system substrate-binding protein